MKKHIVITAQGAVTITIDDSKKDAVKVVQAPHVYTPTGNAATPSTAPTTESKSDPTLRPGVIKRPSQHDLIKRQNPKIEEGKREFKKLIEDTLSDEEKAAIIKGDDTG